MRITGPPMDSAASGKNEVRQASEPAGPGDLKISVFDLDRTLTRRPTYSAFLVFVAWHRSPLRLALLPLVVALMAAYAMRLITRTRFKQLEHRVLLGRSLPGSEIRKLADRFAAFVASAWVSPQARQRIAQERSEGRVVVVASAANSIYLDPIARLLEIGHVVATQSTWRGDALLPDIDGQNCYGVAKRDMLEAYAAQQGWARDAIHVRFFSDHLSDAPTFAWADEPIAVNPSRALRPFAAEHGWPILDWG